MSCAIRLWAALLMLMRVEIELDLGNNWASTADWQALAEISVKAAMAETPYKTAASADFALSVSISLSNDAQVHTLNKQYRDKDKPTNVLSFPMLSADELADLGCNSANEVLLGDIILAQETCAREASEKGIPLQQHATHLIVHGALHLLGYDHIEEPEADAMEALEIKALASMGLPNPYSAG